ncbi:MAG: hypothetical protein J6Z00_01500 [Clostridia bacterium]|nr:hypothetical protein [Clostridia bacterium]
MKKKQTPIPTQADKKDEKKALIGFGIFLLAVLLICGLKIVIELYA